MNLFSLYIRQIKPSSKVKNPRKKHISGSSHEKSTEPVINTSIPRPLTGGGYSPFWGAIAPEGQKWGLFRGLIAPIFLIWPFNARTNKVYRMSDFFIEYETEELCLELTISYFIKNKLKK